MLDQCHGLAMNICHSRMAVDQLLIQKMATVSVDLAVLVSDVTRLVLFIIPYITVKL